MQPNLCAWAAPGDTLRLMEREAQPDNPDPKALACFGGVRDNTEQVYLYYSRTKEDKDDSSGYPWIRCYWVEL